MKREQGINLLVNDRVLGINLQMSSVQQKCYIIERGRSRVPFAYPEISRWPASLLPQEHESSGFIIPADKIAGNSQQLSLDLFTAPSRVRNRRVREELYLGDLADLMPAKQPPTCVSRRTDFVLSV